MPPRKPKLPNILFFGIDSLRADHMSCYGYRRLTTPHMDRFAAQGTLFERYYSPHIPTTSGYASMLTGMDVFSTQVVALRHKGRCGRRSRRCRRSCARRATPPPASASAATRPRAASTPTWISIRLGPLEQGRSRRPRTSTR